LGAGTIYQTLSKLEGDTLIVPTEEVDRKNNYIITDTGREILRREAERIYNLSFIAKEFLA
jgi:DNA-binding PadR family transcriptional regulator